MGTGTMKKPSLAKIVAGLGFEPCDTAHKVLLDASCVLGPFGYFSENVEFAQNFLKSQNLMKLEAAPKDCDVVYVDTAYTLNQDSKQVFESLAAIPAGIHFGE